MAFPSQEYTGPLHIHCLDISPQVTAVILTTRHNLFDGVVNHVQLYRVLYA